MDNILLGIIFSFVFGAIIGSFLNVLIIRLPQQETIGGHSHCMYCKHHLGALDLVPIFSYIFLAGKCRYCRKPISPRYIFIEVITGLLFAFNFYFLNPATSGAYASLLRYDFIVACMIVIFCIDFEHSLILDKFVFPATIVLLLLNLLVDYQTKSGFANSLALYGFLSGLGVFLFFGAMYFFSKGRWIGMGDVKFSFFLGLAAPFPIIIVSLFLSFMIGSFVGVGLLLSNLKKMSSHIPFGTFLALSTVISLYFGTQLIHWYFNLIGIR